MTISTAEISQVRARGVLLTDGNLVVELSDGRSISVPLARYPRLLHGTPSERNHFRLIGGGEGIHWPELDEDLSVENLLLGKRSGESPNSFKRWLAARPRRLRAERIGAESDSELQKRRRRAK